MALSCPTATSGIRTCRQKIVRARERVAPGEMRLIEACEGGVRLAAGRNWGNGRSIARVHIRKFRGPVRAITARLSTA